MDTPRARHLLGAADDVAPWVAGSQIAWDLMARRHAPFTPWRHQDNDGGGIGPGDDPFAMLRELLDRMPAAPPQQAQVGEAQTMPTAVAVNDTGAYDDDDDDAYRNGGFGAVSASSEAIAGLRATSADEARERACAVCLEEFEAASELLRRMPCSHSFHERCIFGWLRASCACPLCRHRLPTERQ